MIADRLEPTIGETCQEAGKRPHMVHDESSFDITAAPGIRIPPGLSLNADGWRKAGRPARRVARASHTEFIPH